MIRVVKTLPELKQLTDWLELKKEQLVAFDTETNGLHPLYNQVLLLQFGDERTQFVVDVARVASPNHGNIKALFKLINSLEIILVAHNAVFDYKMIKGNYEVEIEKIMCTMIGARLLTMGRKSMIATNLAVTLKRHLGIDISKAVRMSFVGMNYGDAFTDEQLEYSGIDVQHLLPLLNKELRLINARGLERVALLEFNTIPVTGDMELNGALIDVKKWMALEKIALQDAETFREELDNYLAPYVDTSRDLFNSVLINYNSPKQLLPVLCTALGFEIEGTGEPVIKKLHHPITDKLLEYRKRTKLAGTYGSEFLQQNLDRDGRIRSSFMQLGTETGRYASKNPNLQNIPADPRYRAPFIAPPGYKFISVDFSGQDKLGPSIKKFIELNTAKSGKPKSQDKAIPS